jgi:hypothetical protein
MFLAWSRSGWIRRSNKQRQNQKSQCGEVEFHRHLKEVSLSSANQVHIDAGQIPVPKKCPLRTGRILVVLCEFECLGNWRK